MDVALMICYARSGGTILNRCIGSLPGVVVLSEVSPLRKGLSSHTPVTVQKQAEDWYGISVKSDGFAEGILEVKKECDVRGLRLVVRIWPVGDFVPMKQNNFSPPERLEEYHELEGRTGLRPFFFVRDPIDIWISNGRRRDFFGFYRRYVEKMVKYGFPVFKYEDFCRDPEMQMKRLCTYAGLPFSGQFHDFNKFRSVTGDVPRAAPSRGLFAGEIRVLPRVHLPKREIRWCNASADMKAASEATGYFPDYYAKKRGPWPGKLYAELADLCSRIFPGV